MQRRCHQALAELADARGGKGALVKAGRFERVNWGELVGRVVGHGPVVEGRCVGLRFISKRVTL